MHLWWKNKFLTWVLYYLSLDNVCFRYNLKISESLSCFKFHFIAFKKSQTKLQNIGKYVYLWNISLLKFLNKQETRERITKIQFKTSQNMLYTFLSKFHFPWQLQNFFFFLFLSSVESSILHLLHLLFDACPPTFSLSSLSIKSSQSRLNTKWYGLNGREWAWKDSL